MRRMCAQALVVSCSMTRKLVINASGFRDIEYLFGVIYTQDLAHLIQRAIIVDTMWSAVVRIPQMFEYGVLVNEAPKTCKI